MSTARYAQPSPLPSGSRSSRSTASSLSAPALSWPPAWGPSCNNETSTRHLRVGICRVDDGTVDELSTNPPVRAESIPNLRARLRQRRYIGNDLGEKANDRIVARRQKRRGMQWGAKT